MLTLTTLRCPAGVSPQRREVARGALSVGRAGECDWMLPDPDCVLSKRHCLLTWQDDSWLVTDVSRNGTFLNGSTLDAGTPRALRTGDHLGFGFYEVVVGLDEDRTGAPSGPGGRDLGSERLTGDPFEPGRAMEAELPVGLPHDFDPLGAEQIGVDPIEAGQTEVDPSFAAPHRASDLHAHFAPPRPSSELLPPDWDHTATGVPATPAPVHVPATRALVEPADAAAGFRAFAAGAGIPGEPRANPEQILRELGAAFRAAVAGLRRVMIARAAIKGEFRIDQTIIRASGNNPLKFATDDDDALASLLGVGRSGMTAERAIAEAMRDMRLHELAMASAMQQAVRELLDGLAPAAILRDLPARSGDALPGRRRQRAWEFFERRHAEARRAVADAGDSAFSRSFMHAYETVLARLAAGGPSAGAEPPNPVGDGT